MSRKSIQKTEVHTTCRVTRTSTGLPLRKIPQENLRKGVIVLQQRPATQLKDTDFTVS